MADGVADQLAQDARQRRPLHHVQADLALELDLPVQFATRHAQPVADVALPLSSGLGQAMRVRPLRACLTTSTVRRVCAMDARLGTGTSISPPSCSSVTWLSAPSAIRTSSGSNRSRMSLDIAGQALSGCSSICRAMR